MKKSLLSCMLALSLLLVTIPLACGCSKPNRAIEGPGTTQQEPEDPSGDSDEPETPSLDGKRFIVCANSMVYYGGLVQNGSQRSADQGMLYKMLANSGVKGHSVVDCCYGGHHLCDFSEGGCIYTDKHGTDGKTVYNGCNGIGFDLLNGLDLKKFDYVIISEAGNNYSHFYSDAVALFERFRSVNPDVKLIYINHIYSVYKNHTNVLGNLKTLHDKLGVTIINCGQLAYDIYTGAVKVPGGSIKYSDRYTFCNHTSSDTYHPNPLMGYIMTQMVYCALTGKSAEGAEYDKLLKSCSYAGGSVSLSDYYGKYYTTAAALPFTTVLADEKEMAGIQSLIPQYINRY